MKATHINNLIIFANGSVQYSYCNGILQKQFTFFDKDITNLFFKKAIKIKSKSENFINYKKFY
jgi:hypothetical protein